jgi:hypothetical protein
MELAFAIGWEYLKMAWQNRSYPKLSLSYVWAFVVLFVVDSLDGN